MNFKREFDKCSCGDRAWNIRETKFWQQIHNNWKEKEKYSKKNENSSKYVPVSALTKNTHESLFFAAALARLGQSCIGAQERITSQQSHTLSVMQSTCQPSGLALSFGSTHRALQRFSPEPQVQSATINKGMRCPYSTFSSRKYASCSMLTCAGTFLFYVLHTCMTYQNCAIFSIYMSSS